MSEIKKIKISKENQSEDNLVWIDCEMTGLDRKKDKLVEIACIITDGNLNIIAEGPDIVIHQDDETLRGMNLFVQNMHRNSGLTREIRNSKISTKEAEDKILSFIQEYAPYGKCPLAGNSVHCDKEFLRNEMPRIVEHLHYRIVDVSSIRELCQRWYHNAYKMPKVGNHRALIDIKESIKELKFYRERAFKKNFGINAE
ncbi:DgyrCDS9735 [Dimorphilus gyrociliatus]|uniref:DgyrCDS9735 n=1 Tax=Dimorphilus gyrociliatus TaxID=2664684 RepID=A0A7I8VZ49_9ANNE|nr:DgyrCDS9735 [Dimorphilus gyrociliatus]